MVFSERYMIVVVDDDDAELTRLSEIYEDEGYEVNVATNYEQLLFCLEEDVPDLLVINFSTNINLKKELLLRVRGDERFYDLSIIGLFKDFTTTTIDNFIDLGIDSICKYPFTNKELVLKSEHLVDIMRDKKVIEQKTLALIAANDEINALKLELTSRQKDIQILREKISRVAVLDSLTGLFNRTYALEQLEMAISRFNRKQIVSAVLLCDIDNLNEINSLYGHNIGDSIIREVGASISSRKRQQDVISRYAGGTFIIILPDTDVEGAKYFAERARTIAQDRTFGDENEVKLTLTFGVSVYNSFMPFDMLMKMTEDSLTFGKESGKNKVIVANELMKLI